MNCTQAFFLRLLGMKSNFDKQVRTINTLMDDITQLKVEVKSLTDSRDYWKGLQAQTAKERDSELSRAINLLNELKSVKYELEQTGELQSKTVGLLTEAESRLDMAVDRLAIAKSALDEKNKAYEELNKKFHEVLDERADLLSKLDLEKIETRKMAELLTNEQKKFSQSQHARLQQRDTIANLQADIDILKQDLAKIQSQKVLEETKPVESGNQSAPKNSHRRKFYKTNEQK